MENKRLESGGLASRHPTGVVQKRYTPDAAAGINTASASTKPTYSKSCFRVSLTISGPIDHDHVASRSLASRNQAPF